MEKFYSKQIQLKIDFDCECIFLRFDPAQILLPKSTTLSCQVLWLYLQFHSNYLPSATNQIVRIIITHLTALHSKNFYI